MSPKQTFSFELLAEEVHRPLVASAHNPAPAILAFLQAGFAAPAAELEYKVSTATAGAESLKDMLARIKPYTTPGATNKHGCCLCSQPVL